MKCGNSVEYWTLHLNWSYLEINEKNVFIYLELELAKERCKYVLLRMWIYYEKHTVYAYPHWYKESQKWALFLLAPLRLYEPTPFVGELWSNKPESRPYQSWEKNEHPNDCISAFLGHMHVLVMALWLKFVKRSYQIWPKRNRWSRDQAERCHNTIHASR